MRYKCFFVEPTNKVNVYLRRYTVTGICPGAKFHEALFPVDSRTEAGNDLNLDLTSKDLYNKEDPRWPAKCDHCDYVFRFSDKKQVFARRVGATNDGQLYEMNPNLPVGAIYDVPHLQDYEATCGSDGRSLAVITPGGLWMLDVKSSSCFNCKPSHKCWSRNGTPPFLTVEKNCEECHPGVGTINFSNFKGNLRDGWLEDA